MLEDKLVTPSIQDRETVFFGRVWDVLSESFTYNGELLHREFVDHPGAVGILALNEKNQALVIQQYRQPVKLREWEIVAGLMDTAQESPLNAAKRELAEEVDLAADAWHTLTEFSLSPGGSNELMRVYLAQDLRKTGQSFTREAEEADMQKLWVDLDELVESILAARVQNPVLMISGLSAWLGLRNQWANLRSAELPWSRHARLHSDG